MSSFTKPLVLEALDEELDGQGEFTVYEPFQYDIGFLGSGDSVQVPKGFRTDLCSVPAVARSFIPLSGRLAKPSLVHDYLLEQGDPRAHDVFDEAMAVNKVSPVTRWLVSKAVRIYWWFKPPLTPKCEENCSG